MCSNCLNICVHWISMGGSQVRSSLITKPPTVKDWPVLSSQTPRDKTSALVLANFFLWAVVSVSWVSYRFLPTWYLGLPDFLCIVLCLRFVFTTKWSLLLLTTHSLHCKLSVNSLGLHYPMLTSGFSYLLFTLCTWFSGSMMSTFTFFVPHLLFIYCHVDKFSYCDYNIQCHTLTASISYSVLTFFCSIYFLSY